MNWTSCLLSWVVPATEWSREPDLTLKTLIQRQTRMTSRSTLMDATTVPPWNPVGRFHYHMGTGTGWTGYMTASLLNPAEKLSCHRPNNKALIVCFKETMVALRNPEGIRFSDHHSKCSIDKILPRHKVQRWIDIFIHQGILMASEIHKGMPVREMTLSLIVLTVSSDMWIPSMSFFHQIWAMLLIQHRAGIQTEIINNSDNQSNMHPLPL